MGRLEAFLQREQGSDGCKDGETGKGGKTANWRCNPGPRPGMKLRRGDGVQSYPQCYLQFCLQFTANQAAVCPGMGFGIMPRRIAVCSRRQLMTSRHFPLPFPSTLSLRRRWPPSASPPLRALPLPLPGPPSPPYTPFHSLGMWCQRKSCPVCQVHTEEGNGPRHWPGVSRRTGNAWNCNAPLTGDTVTGGGGGLVRGLFRCRKFYCLRQCTSKRG